MHEVPPGGIPVPGIQRAGGARGEPVGDGSGGAKTSVMDDAVTEVVRVALGLGGPLGSDEEVGAALADAAEEGDLMLENDASDERVAVTVKLAGADGRVEPAVLAVGAGVDERNSVCDEAPEADFTEPLCAALALISADRERVDSCVGSAEPDADEVAVTAADEVAVPTGDEVRSDDTVGHADGA